jgi:hypothetical protein
MKIHEFQAKQILREAGVAVPDFKGFSRVLDIYGVRHALREHGDEATETARGQVPIEEKDFGLIPEIVERVTNGKTYLARARSSSAGLRRSC